MRITYFVLIAVVAFSVTIIFLDYPGINDDMHSKFEDMINGKAHKPFVYRTLIPTSVKIISQIIPDSMKDMLTEKVENSYLLSKTFNKLRWESRLAVEYFVASLLMYLSLLGFAFAIRYLFNLFYITSEIYTNLFSVFALLALPPFFVYTSFLYDFPNLLLFTSGLILLKKQKWNIFIPFLIISTINKETTILLIATFYFYYRGRIPKELFKNLLLIQILTYLATKISLYFIFRNNLGTFVEFHLIDHNLRLLKHYDLTTAVAFLSSLILIFYKWKESPSFLKVSFSMVIPLLILSLFLGYIDELRGYYEVFPAVIILIYYNVARIFDIKLWQKELNN